MSRNDSGGLVEAPSAVEYRIIHGFTKHRVGTDGSVWRLVGGVRWVQMTGEQEPSGYVRITITERGVSRRYRVHVIVLETFIGPRPNGMDGAHDNGKRSDNRLSNLLWKTKVENEADKLRHGTRLRGERNAAAKLTAPDVVRIRQEASGNTQAALARRFGVSSRTIRKILSGALWAHVCEGGS